MQVMAGWRLFISGHGRPARLRLEDVRIHAYDSSGWVTCTEMLDFAESRGRQADHDMPCCLLLAYCTVWDIDSADSSGQPTVVQLMPFAVPDRMSMGGLTYDLQSSHQIRCSHLHQASCYLTGSQWAPMPPWAALQDSSYQHI